MKIESRSLHCHVAKTLVFWCENWLGGDVPFHIKFALEVTHPSEKCRLPPISAYTVLTVRASQKSSIIINRKSTVCFPTSRWTAYVTPKSSKGGSKSKFVIFVNKNQLKSNKLCYKVSLYENFQQQSCSRTIPLSNGVYMLHNISLLDFGSQLAGLHMHGGRCNPCT